jgi:hypothetical protein
MHENTAVRCIRVSNLVINVGLGNVYKVIVNFQLPIIRYCGVCCSHERTNETLADKVFQIHALSPESCRLRIKCSADNVF